MDINPETVAAKLAGAAGAFISMRFLQGTWLERFFMAISGALLSYYLAPFLAIRTGLPESVSGFLLGLFGMAVVSRMWEWIQTTPIAESWRIFLRWLSNRAGVKPEDTKNEP